MTLEHSNESPAPSPTPAPAQPDNIPPDDHRGTEHKEHQPLKQSARTIRATGEARPA